MPRLTADELSILRALSEPLEQSRRPAFLHEAVKRIEEAAPQGGLV
jgi:hypothetical protein